MVFVSEQILSIYLIKTVSEGKIKVFTGAEYQNSMLFGSNQNVLIESWHVMLILYMYISLLILG